MRAYSKRQFRWRLAQARERMAIYGIQDDRVENPTWINYSDMDDLTRCEVTAEFDLFLAQLDSAVKEADSMEIIRYTVGESKGKLETVSKFRAYHMRKLGVAV